MRLLTAVLAALLASTASAQTPAAPEGAAPPAPEATPAPVAPAAAPAKKEDESGFFIRSGADSMKVYALIDATISTVDNKDATGARKTGYQTAWFNGNRWGLLPRHVVNEDLSVIGKLESEYVVATGEMDTPNVLFNRDAWIGVDSKLIGQLTFGRQNTLARDFAQNYGDPYGTANVRMDEGGWTNTNNFKQLIYYAASATGTRMDNGIVLKRKVGDFMVGLGGQIGGVTGHPSQNNTLSLGLAWNGGPYNVSGYYTTSDVAGLAHHAYAIGGNATPISLLRLNAGVFMYDAAQGAGGGLAKRKDTAWTVSAKLMPATDFDAELGYVTMKADNAGYNAAGTSTLNPFASTTGVTTVGTGSRATVYGSLIYRLDKRSDVYLAGDYLKLSDGYKVAGTNGYSSQTELAVGMRFRI